MGHCHGWSFPNGLQPLLVSLDSWVMRLLSGCAISCSFSSVSLQVTCSFLKSIDCCILVRVRMVIIKITSIIIIVYYCLVVLLRLFSSKAYSLHQPLPVMERMRCAGMMDITSAAHTAAPELSDTSQVRRKMEKVATEANLAMFQEKMFQVGCVWGRCSKDVPSSEVQHHSTSIVPLFKKYL